MKDDQNENPNNPGPRTGPYDEQPGCGSTIDANFETQPEFEDKPPELANALRMLKTEFPKGDGSGNSATQAQDSSTMTKIGRFPVKRRLGGGSFGSVWLAHDPLLKRDVAVKVAHVGVHASAQLLERFTQEARLVARLHHPNIVPVFETGEDSGRLFIVSEYCSGASLADWLRHRERPVPPLLATTLVRQLADAAEHAHRQGLIHRDIKPGNVLLTYDPSPDSDFVPRLTDFGLARDLTVDESSTRTGQVLGTPEYMPPEQAKGEHDIHGPGSDVYSLGVLLYRLLTGTAPFTGTSDYDVVQKITAAEPTSPSRVDSNIGRDLSSICLRCLEKRPEQRYATAADLRDDLDRFLRGEPTVARPISTMERVTRWTKRAPAAAGLILVSTVSLLAIVAGLAFHLRTVEQDARELTAALNDARHARDGAKMAQSVAEAQREFARETSYRSDMRLAFDQWAKGQFHSVKQILARQAADDGRDLRGPEWYVLNADSVAKHREIGRHKGAITECVVTADWQTAYTAGVDGRIRVWNLNSRTVVETFAPGIGEIHAIALAKDESTLAIGGPPQLPEDRANVVTLDSASGKRIGTFQSHETTIESIEYSPDGQWLAAGSRYDPVQLTRLTDGKSFSLPSDQRNRDLSFSSDSDFLCVSASDSNVAVWELSSGKPQLSNTLQSENLHHPYVSVFLPGSPTIATAFTDTEHLALFNLTQQTPHSIARNQTSAAITCLGFSGDSSLLAAGDESGTLTIWKPEVLRKQQHSLPWGQLNPQIDSTTASTVHKSRITSVNVSDDAVLVSGGEDGRLVMTAPFAVGAQHFRWELTAAAAVLNDNELLLGCLDGTVRSHAIGNELSNNEALNTPTVLYENPNPVSSLALSPEVALVATGTINGGVLVHSRHAGETASIVFKEGTPSTDAAILAIAFSSDGRLLAYTGERNLLKVHDAKTGEEIFSTQLPGSGWSVAFLPGDRRLACGGQFEDIHVFDLNVGSLLQRIPGEGIDALQVSRDGRWMVSIHQNGTTQVIDLVEDKPPVTISSDNSSGESIIFSANSRTIVSLHRSNRVGFADVESGTVFGQLTLPKSPSERGSPVHSVHCNNDHLIAVTGYHDDTTTDVYVWRLDQTAKMK